MLLRKERRALKLIEKMTWAWVFCQIELCIVKRSAELRRAGDDTS
jgi:hypothetical protein